MKCDFEKCARLESLHFSMSTRRLRATYRAAPEAACASALRFYQGHAKWRFSLLVSAQRDASGR